MDRARHTLTLPPVAWCAALSSEPIFEPLAALKSTFSLKIFKRSTIANVAAANDSEQRRGHYLDVAAGRTMRGVIQRANL